MRFPTLLSAASFALALASPALAQQPQDMREEIRRIVREEVRAALREAMQEMHGVAPKAGGGEAAKTRRDPPAQADKATVRRLVQPGQSESLELRALETELKELETTLERLQGEIGRKVGGELRELRPLLHSKLQGGNLEGMRIDLKDVTHGVEGTRVLKIDRDGEAIELEVSPRIHVITPKVRLEDSAEKQTGTKEKKEAKSGEEKETRTLWIESQGKESQGKEKAEEAKPKASKAMKAAKAPLATGTSTLPVLDKAVAAKADGCNCVIVIRCENGQCTVETNCDGAQKAPLQFKTLTPKAMKKADGDSEDCTLEIKLDTGCCDQVPAKAKSDCCTGGACTDCAPAKPGCCDEAKTESKKPEAKTTEKDKKKLIS
jgi:hypothetical protein